MSPFSLKKFRKFSDRRHRLYIQFVEFAQNIERFELLIPIIFGCIFAFSLIDDSFGNHKILPGSSDLLCCFRKTAVFKSCGAVSPSEPKGRSAEIQFDENFFSFRQRRNTFRQTRRSMRSMISAATFSAAVGRNGEKFVAALRARENPSVAAEF
jgi:hypothetical protein